MEVSSTVSIYLIGRVAEPPWLWSESVLEALEKVMGISGWEGYRQYVEQAVREGELESPWERLESGPVLGGVEFVKRLRTRLKGSRREQGTLKRLVEVKSFDEVVAAVESEKGERWGEFRDRYGDWGRDLVLYLGRCCCGMSLAALGSAAGGIDYAPVLASVAERLAGKLLNIVT